jgi:hypothetical protein
MSKWISVKDRLPIQQGDYLVAMAWDANSRIVPIRVRFYGGDTGWEDENPAHCAREVITHWMPLPPAPVSGNENAPA